MSKFMIRCDMEGASGVVSYNQCTPEHAEYAFGQRMFMHDLTALIDSLNAIGAEEIIIYDEHYYGRNIDLQALPVNAKAICGKPPYRPDWPGGLDSSFTGLILLGLHAKAGTPGALLPHTYELDIKDIRLNGMSVGEIGVEAAIAGDAGVPTLLVIADSAGAAEARELIPNVSTVMIKEAISESSATCHSLPKVYNDVSDVVKKLTLMANVPKPLVIEAPIQLEVELHYGEYLTSMKKLFPGSIMQGNIVALEGKSVTETWSDYWKMKLVATTR